MATTPRERVALIASLTAHATPSTDERVLTEIALVLDGASVQDLADLRAVR
ncbi:hypothetical protein [Actinotalea sp.]|uniref:hypothetical protein n=1 Tax=Actinotalea sp. TaxID=1872145 RepID=UPI003569C3CD